MENPNTVSTVYNDELTSFIRSLSKDSVACLDVTSEFIFISTTHGTLIIVDRGTFTVTEPFSGLFGKIVCTGVRKNERNVYIAIGFDSGAVSFVSLSLNDARKYLVHVARDCHRNSAVTDVSWSEDCSQVFTADESGLIIVSKIDFSNDSFGHLFHSMSSIPSNKIICTPDFLFMILKDGSYQFVDSDSGESIPIKLNIERFHEVVSCSCVDKSILIVCKHIVFAVELDETGNNWTSRKVFESEETICCSSVCGNYICLIYLNNAQILTISDMNLIYQYDSDQIASEKLCCVDHDGSLLYVAHSNRLFRASLTPLTNVLSEVTDEKIDITTLLESPRKIGASLLKRASNVFQVVASASEIEVSTEVPKMIESGINAIKNNSNFNSVVERVQNFVDSQNSADIIEGLPDRYPINLSRSLEETAIDSTVSVERTAKARGPKRRESERACPEEKEENLDASLTIEPSDSIINELRRHVLGHGGESSSPPVKTESSISSINGQNEADDVFSNSFCSSFQSPAALSNQREAFDSGPSSFSDKFNASFVSCLTDVNSYSRGEAQASHINEVEEEKDDEFESENPPQPEDTVSTVFDILMNSQRNDALPIESAEAPDNFEMAKENHLKNSFIIPESCDIWKESSLPHQVCSLSLFDNKIVLSSRRQKPRYTELCELGKKDVSWLKLDWNAHEISFSDDGLDVIRLHKGRCYKSDVGLSSMPSEEVPVVGANVTNVILRNDNIWYNTEELGPCVLLRDLSHTSFSRLTCEWPLFSLTVSDYAIWAVRKEKGSLMARVGLARCRMGDDWAETMPESMKCVVSVSLYGTNGFVLDDEGRLWMATGVDQHHPFGRCSRFLEVRVPWPTQCTKTKYNEWKLLASSYGIFVCTNKSLYSAFNSVLGHGFPMEISNKYAALDNFSLLSASSFTYDDYSLESDSIFLCRPNSDVFVFRPKRKVLTNLSLPPKVLTITSISSHNFNLSVVDSLGNVYSRNRDGIWLEHEQLPPGGIISYSESSMATWLITCDGSIKSKTNADSCWLTHSINIVSSGERKATQISCSPNGRYIWVNDGISAWARTNVDSHNPSGKRWAQTHHSKGIMSVAAGDFVVYALDESYNLLRLQGLAAGNPAGNTWKHVSSGIRAISIDSHNCLWVINGENRLVRYMCAIFPDRT